MKSPIAPTNPRHKLNRYHRKFLHLVFCISLQRFDVPFRSTCVRFTLFLSLTHFFIISFLSCLCYRHVQKYLVYLIFEEKFPIPAFSSPAIYAILTVKLWNLKSLRISFYPFFYVYIIFYILILFFFFYLLYLYITVDLFCGQSPVPLENAHCFMYVYFTRTRYLFVTSYINIYLMFDCVLPL